MKGIIPITSLNRGEQDKIFRHRLQQSEISHVQKLKFCRGGECGSGKAIASYLLQEYPAHEEYRRHALPSSIPVQTKLSGDV